MNRYRTLPSSQQRATATTVCQKCLKKGHYSYECKAGTQERPYTSRPSRSQQLRNPKLKPKLTSETPNDLLNSEGIADKHLAEAEAERRSSRSLEKGPFRPRRAQSYSSASSNSVSSISTNRSELRGGTRRMANAVADQDAHRSSLTSPLRKRKRSKSADSRSRSPLMETDPMNKNRRYRDVSPYARGRPAGPATGNSGRRSRSRSLDQSKVAKNRRSFDLERGGRQDGEPVGRRQKSPTDSRPNQSFRRPATRENESTEDAPPRRRERSLSPYSRRLALTQAMNSSR